jgi:uncharacterized tellurite resistance protein B-like protein
VSLDISADTETRLLAAANAEGISVDTLVQLMIDEREGVAAICRRPLGLPPEEIRAKIERGYAQSERGEFVDGEDFAGELLAELDELERKRPA